MLKRKVLLSPQTKEDDKRREKIKSMLETVTFNLSFLCSSTIEWIDFCENSSEKRKFVRFRPQLLLFSWRSNVILLLKHNQNFIFLFCVPESLMPLLSSSFDSELISTREIRKKLFLFSLNIRFRCSVLFAFKKGMLLEVPSILLPLWTSVLSWNLRSISEQNGTKMTSYLTNTITSVSASRLIICRRRWEIVLSHCHSLQCDYDSLVWPPFEFSRSQVVSLVNELCRPFFSQPLRLIMTTHLFYLRWEREREFVK